MTKKIIGTWFEFQHHNIPEGKYWDPITAHFSAEQWDAKVGEIASLGMKNIFLLCTSLVYEDKAESYFPTDIYPQSKLACKNPIEVLLTAADKYGIGVYMSVGYYGVWTHTYDNMTSPEVQARAFKSMEQLWGLYGHHKSFVGWYLPDETCINKYYDENFIKYVNDYAKFGRAFDKKLKIFIAPYGTNILVADDKYVSQLESLDCDIIAYQDEVGVRKSVPENTGKYYEALRKAHDKAGRAQLWVDMEIFEFEGDVYRSALIPASIDRIQKQLEAVSPYVDAVSCYEYQGMMNKPGSIAFCGHPGSIKLFEDYKNLLDKGIIG